MHQAFYGLMLCRRRSGIRQVPDMASTKSGKTSLLPTLVFVRGLGLGVALAWALPWRVLGADWHCHGHVEHGALVACGWHGWPSMWHDGILVIRYSMIFCTR